jgi:hypothetical protein
MRRSSCTSPARPVQLSGEILLGLRDSMLRQIKRQLEGTDKAADRAWKRIVKLEMERRTLLQAHLAGAVPLELLKEEQNRSTEELARAGAELAHTEVDWQTVQERVTAAVKLVSQLRYIYAEADPATRKRINQTVWAPFRCGRRRRRRKLLSYARSIDNSTVHLVLRGSTAGSVQKAS